MPENTNEIQKVREIAEQYKTTAVENNDGKLHDHMKTITDFLDSLEQRESVNAEGLRAVKQDLGYSDKEEAFFAAGWNACLDGLQSQGYLSQPQEELSGYEAAIGVKFQDRTPQDNSEALIASEESIEMSKTFFNTSGWQDIETAPKDGRTVMVWRENNGGIWWGSYHKTDGWRVVYGNNKVHAEDITHWMPLPQPPEKQGGNDGR